MRYVVGRCHRVCGQLAAECTCPVACDRPRCRGSSGLGWWGHLSEHRSTAEHAWHGVCVGPGVPTRRAVPAPLQQPLPNRQGGSCAGAAKASPAAPRQLRRPAPAAVLRAAPMSARGAQRRRRGGSGHGEGCEGPLVGSRMPWVCWAVSCMSARRLGSCCVVWRWGVRASARVAGGLCAKKTRLQGQAVG